MKEAGRGMDPLLIFFLTLAILDAMISKLITRYIRLHREIEYAKTKLPSL